MSRLPLLSHSTLEVAIFSIADVRNHNYYYKRCSDSKVVILELSSLPSDREYGGNDDIQLLLGLMITYEELALWCAAACKYIGSGGSALMTEGTVDPTLGPTSLSTDGTRWFREHSARATTGGFWHGEPLRGALWAHQTVVPKADVCSAASAASGTARAWQRTWCKCCGRCFNPLELMHTSEDEWAAANPPAADARAVVVETYARAAAEAAAKVAAATAAAEARAAAIVEAHKRQEAMQQHTARTATATAAAWAATIYPTGGR